MVGAGIGQCEGQDSQLQRERPCRRTVGHQRERTGVEAGGRFLGDLDRQPELLGTAGLQGHGPERLAVGAGLDEVIKPDIPLQAGVLRVPVARPDVLGAFRVVHAQVVLAGRHVDLHEGVVLEQQLGDQFAMARVVEVAGPGRPRLPPALDDAKVQTLDRNDAGLAAERGGADVEPRHVSEGGEDKGGGLVLVRRGEAGDPVRQLPVRGQAVRGAADGGDGGDHVADEGRLEPGGVGGQAGDIPGQTASVGDGLPQGIEVVRPSLLVGAQGGRLRLEGGHITVPVRVHSRGGPKRLEAPVQLREGRAGSRRDVPGKGRDGQGRQKRGNENE